MTPFPSFDPTGATIVRGPAPRPETLPAPSVRILGDVSYPGSAYDETQTSDAIKDGDVMVIPGVAVGVMVAAWPVLVAGDLEATGWHELSEGADVSCLGQQGWGRWFAGMRYFPKDGPPEGVEFPGGGEYLPPRGGADYTASFDLANRSATLALARLGA